MSSLNQKAIGQRIKKAREKTHLTQEQLAELVDLSPMHISVIERGAKPPKLETLVNIANADMPEDSYDKKIGGPKGPPIFLFFRRRIPARVFH